MNIELKKSNNRPTLRILTLGIILASTIVLSLYPLKISVSVYMQLVLLPKLFAWKRNVCICIEIQKRTYPQDFDPRHNPGFYHSALALPSQD